MNRHLKTFTLLLGEANAIITNPKNIYYFTGINTEGAYLIIIKDDIHLLVNSLQYDYIVQTNKNTDIKVKQTSTFHDDVVSILSNYESLEVLMDSYDTSYQFGSYLKNSLRIHKFIITNRLNKLISVCRSSKSDKEVSYIKTACNIAEGALLKTIPFIKPGITEKDIEAELIKNISENGNRIYDGEILIHSGPNTSLVHGKPSSRIIEKNDLILIDFGVKHQGYNCDITRMISVGQPAEEIKNMYNTMLDIYNYISENITENPSMLSAKTSLMIANSGIPGVVMDHAIGHGVGLDLHEHPTIGAHNIHDNMVLAIEPGLYYPNKYGVRIENTVLIQDNKCKLLNDIISNDLIII